MSDSRLFVGIGSPHGDDRVGWEIARRVNERLGSFLEVRCARTPAELLDWLEGVDTLDVCDALVGEEAGSVRCWKWPAPEIGRAPFRGTHDIALPAALMLADQLGCLPRSTRIWGIGIKPSLSSEALSPDVAVALSTVIERVCEAFPHA